MTDRVELVSDEPTLASIYRQLFEPTFPPQELVSFETLKQIANSDRGRVVALRGDQMIHGAAVVEFYPGGTCVLAYLAVNPHGRSRGHGKKLLSATLDVVAGMGFPTLLAEIEPPGFQPAKPEHGDPRRRVEFYARFGARALAVEHWQPAVTPEQPPVRLTLIALPTSGDQPLAPITSDQLRQFEQEYHDGAVPARTLADLEKSPTVTYVDLGAMY